MVRVNINILGISELKWTGTGKFNSEDHSTVGKNPLEEMEELFVNQRVWNAVLGCNLKNDWIILFRFQGEPFNTTVIQVYASTTDAEEAKIEQFHEDL